MSGLPDVIGVPGLFTKNRNNGGEEPERVILLCKKVAPCEETLPFGEGDQIYFFGLVGLVAHHFVEFERCNRQCGRNAFGRMLNMRVDPLEYLRQNPAHLAPMALFNITRDSPVAVVENKDPHQFSRLVNRALSFENNSASSFS